MVDYYLCTGPRLPRLFVPRDNRVMASPLIIELHTSSRIQSAMIGFDTAYFMCISIAYRPLDQSSSKADALLDKLEAPTEYNVPRRPNGTSLIQDCQRLRANKLPLAHRTGFSQCEVFTQTIVLVALHLITQRTVNLES